MISEKHKKQLSIIHESNKTHGLRKLPIYDVWAQMIQRCENKKHKSYALYGGRGITVCSEWHRFKVFYDWAINNGYELGLTLDREDNDRGYYHENCRWVTQKVQCNNNRRNIKFEYNGETKNLSQWVGGNKKMFDRMYDRIFRQGWEFERALNTPVNEKFINKRFK